MLWCSASRSLVLIRVTLPHGTKSGCRRLFAEEGVPHPLGYEDIDGLQSLVAGLARLRSERPRVSEAIVKLNEGVSGKETRSSIFATSPLRSAGEISSSSAVCGR